MLLLMEGSYVTGKRESNKAALLYNSDNVTRWCQI